MTLNIIFAVFILGISLCWLRWSATGGLLIAFSVISYGSIASGLVPDYLMSRLQSPFASQLQSPLEDNTVFVVLGLGTQAITEENHQVVEPLAFSFGPIFAAAKYLRQCELKNLQCRLIASGGNNDDTGISEADSIADQLKKAGIDDASIITESRSHNSWQNAKFTSQILRELKPAKVVLLQSAPFLRRNLVYFNHFGLKPTPIAAAYLTTSHTNISSAGLNFLVFDVALHEQIGLWRYQIYNFLGWNEPAQPPLITADILFHFNKGAARG